MFDISTIICGFGAGAYVLSKCYIGGITTNIEKSKRVPIPHLPVMYRYVFIKPYTGGITTNIGF